MPSLDPAVAEIRRAVRAALEPLAGQGVVIGLSGGADSLALTAAMAFEAPKADVRASVVVVDHALQDGSADVAERAAAQARELGLEARVIRVDITPEDIAEHGPEGAARLRRSGAFHQAMVETDSDTVVVAHTLDDQAETVLLGLARGSGAGSMQGMAARSGWTIRPLLGVRRETTRAACRAQGLEPWEDPHNVDPTYARVRVRHTVLPVLETEIGPGITEALARTAEQLREDNDAFTEMIEETIEDIVEPAEAGIAISAKALEANPAALRNRIIRYVVDGEFGVSLTRTQTLEVARLVTDWRGQGPIDLPGCSASRRGNLVIITARDA